MNNIWHRGDIEINYNFAFRVDFTILMLSNITIVFLA